MEIVQVTLVLIFTFLAGFFGSMLGLGGGFIMVPALTLGLGLDIKVAISASLIGIIANSSTASTTYLKEGLTNVKLGLVLETATALGAIIGALIAVLIHSQTLAFIFALVLIILAIFMYLRPEEIHVAKEANEKEEKSKDTYLDLSGEYYDKGFDKKVKYEAKSVEKGLAASFVAGNLSGIMGIGGGVVKVPTMNLLMNVPMKVAIATSTFMLGITAVAGALIYYSFGYVDSVITVLVIIGIIVGAKSGSMLARKIETAMLKKGFIVVLIIISVLMFMKALGVYPI